QRVACRAVALLGTIAECEERFGTARGGALARDFQHIVDGKVRPFERARRFGEGAVATGVAAQLRQRNEHLRRERNDVAVSLAAQAGGFIHERAKRAAFQAREPGGDVAFGWTISIGIRQISAPGQSIMAGSPAFFLRSLASLGASVANGKKLSFAVAN